MSDETNIPDNFEEDKELLVEEVQPKEQEQQLPIAEGHETEVLPIYSQLKQLQKQMSQVQKESEKIRLSLSSKKTSTKKKKSKNKK